MSVTISAAELTCYVELVSLFFEFHERDPNERASAGLICPDDAGRPGAKELVAAGAASA